MDTTYLQWVECLRCDVVLVFVVVVVDKLVGFVAGLDEGIVDSEYYIDLADDDSVFLQ